MQNTLEHGWSFKIEILAKYYPLHFYFVSKKENDSGKYGAVFLWKRVKKKLQLGDTINQKRWQIGVIVRNQNTSRFFSELNGNKIKCTSSILLLGNHCRRQIGNTLFPLFYKAQRAVFQTISTLYKVPRSSRSLQKRSHTHRLKI